MMSYKAHRIQCEDGQTVALHDLGGRGPLLLILHAGGFLGQVIWQHGACTADGQRTRFTANMCFTLADSVHNLSIIYCHAAAVPVCS